MLAVVLAAITWRVVEELFRRGRLPRGYRLRGFAMAGAAALILAFGSTTMNAFGERDIAAAAMDDVAADGEIAPVAGEESLDTTAATDRTDPTFSVDGAPRTSAVVPDGSLVSDPDPTESPAAASSAAPGPSGRIKGALPRGLTPKLVKARDDRDLLHDNGCGLPLGPAHAHLSASWATSMAASWSRSSAILMRRTVPGC